MGNWTACILLLLANLVPSGASSQISIVPGQTKPVNTCKSYIERIYETGTDHAVLIEKSHYIFDVSGKIKEKIAYNTLDSSVAEYTINYQYDDDQLIEESAENMFKISYVYNALGNLVARKFKFIDGQYLDRYEYDAKNNLSSKFRYKEDGELHSSEKYNYDHNNRLINWQYNNIDSVIRNLTTGYTRDLDGNILQERNYASNGQILSSKSYQYDSHGNVVEERSYSSGGVLRTRKRYRYTYDTAFNWISCDQTSNNASYRILRTFSY